MLQGGLYNSTLRALELLGCADTFGNSRIPLVLSECDLSARAG